MHTSSLQDLYMVQNSAFLVRDGNVCKMDIQPHLIQQVRMDSVNSTSPKPVPGRAKVNPWCHNKHLLRNSTTALETQSTLL